MKLLALTHSLSDVDGVGRYGTEILKRMEPHCEKVTVLIARKHRGVTDRLPKNIDVRVALPPDYWLYLGWPRFLAYFAMSFPSVYRAVGQADLVHALSDYPHAMLAVLAARMRGKPVIVSGHGTYSVAPFDRPGHRRMIRNAYSSANAVLMGSEFALGKLKSRANLANSRVVPYGVDFAQFDGIEGLNVPAGTPRRYVLTIGELKERKGHHISIPAFLKAAKEHEDVHLVVVGNYLEDDPYFLARKKEIAEASMDSRVHFVGNVTEQEKLALLAKAEVFLLTPVTSREGGFEAFGLVFLEANACGVPTVGIRDSGAQDAILDGETGFLADAGDIAGVAKCLGRLLGDEDLRTQLGQRGTTFARENDWDGAGEILLEVYAQVLSK